jgi:glycosyltransferase involved in cell wall biosynthesis
LQRSDFSRWTVGRALSGASCVVVPCSHTQRLIAQAGYDVPDNKIRTITLGVDTAVFNPRHSRNGAQLSASTTADLIHVASLVGVKDQATLLRALARLDGVALNIVGTGPERPGLERLAAELGIAWRVQFAGAVQHLDLPDYYRQATLNILSSRHEGLGMVVLEAAACGVPTVGAAVGLLPDLPRLGVAVPVGDASALAHAIKALLDDPAQRAALGKSAREAVASAFTIQHTVEQLGELYLMLEARSYD